MNIKNIITTTSVIVGLFLNATPTLAHVSVVPSEIGVAKTQDFTVSFNIEKDIPTTAIRLLIPNGVTSVAPYTTPGWKIDFKKEGDGEGAKVTEIIWSGGSIPPGQRGQFQFRAQVPGEEKTLAWKAYQTYSDGSVYPWDQDPVAGMTDEQREEMEKSGKGPYAQTKVINDLSGFSVNGNTTDNSMAKSVADATLPTILSIVATLIAGGSFWMQMRKKG